MPYSPTAEAALLKWVNLFPLDSPIESAADLTDGYVFSKMLEDIDPKYAVHDLDRNTSPSKWLTKKKSLEAVYKSLFRYIREECPDVNQLGLENPVNFSAIAEHDDRQQTTKLLTIFLSAAVQGPRNEHYVMAITTRLEPVAQGEIKNIIEKMITGEAIATSSDAHPSDHGLALEEEVATLRKDLDNEIKKHADTRTRLERLQVNNEELLLQDEKKDERIQALEGASRGDQSDYINNLLQQIQEQNNLIEKQESQAESDRVTKESYLKELLSLRPSRDRLVEVEDQVKELKQANIELGKKANTVDHYQRKLAHQVTVEKENIKLREQVEVLEANQVHFDKVHAENEKINSTLQAYQRKFESYELEIVEHATHKSLLEKEMRLQSIKIESLLARQQHDEGYIKDLQEEVRTKSTGPLSPDSPTANGGGLNLEQELEQSAEDTPNYALEISRLKSENNALKDGDRRTDNANLRIDLAESERIRKRIEENLRELTEKHAITQEQLSAVISSSSGEKLVQLTDQLLNIGPLQILTDDFYRNEALAHTRKLYLEASQELSAIKSKLAVVEAELTGRDREVIAAKADLSAVSRDDLDAIEELKATNSLITTSLENDLLVLRKQYQDLSTDFELQKSQLLDTLLSKDRLMQDLASLKDRTGTSELEKIERAKARSTKETELEQVRAIAGPEYPAPTAKKSKFLGRISRLSLFSPFTAKKDPVASEVSPRPTTSRSNKRIFRQTDETTRLALEGGAVHSKRPVDQEALLAHELAALGRGTTIPRPEISPRLIQLPPSPLTAHLQRFHQISKKDTLIEDLQRKLKTAEENTPETQKAANESMIKNLTRENALIATAWYDLTSRLQSNHVVLQRRQDAPKSWLNKQRQMVQATGRR
ncbi:uncharacterized protein PAC_03852 [Phialocephala subalpina]|uniref:Calponin-homology (CH) domain-containing protein n=1 Tax=Phialocephala subalpina TaxID=576137 RepID=A0A1L7WMF8_9HELO|nr:uncharacterized protein PAC_03852 [Phialocephala subalpina]